jgi:drug/metabolite transporter (DMT)-like permease
LNAQFIFRRRTALKKLQIPSAVALVIGIVMAIWSGRLPLHQNDMANQTNGEFIIYNALSAGGVLIALIAAFGLGRSSHK